MPDGQQPVWPIEFEGVFSEAVAATEHLTSHLTSSGFRGRFDRSLWIAMVYYRSTGLMRSPRQISSHLQQRRKWFRKTCGDEMSWNEFIGIKYGYIVEDGDYDHIGEDEGDEPFEFVDRHEADDHSRSAIVPDMAYSASASLASYVDGELAPAFEKITLVPACDT